MLSVDLKWRFLSRQINRKSLFLSSLITIVPFYLLLARRSSAVTPSTSPYLCLRRIRVWNPNASLFWSLILFQWFKSASSSLCFISCMFTKLLPHEEVFWPCDFLAAPLNVLFCNRFVLTASSFPRIWVWSLHLFLSCSSIWSQWMKSACIFCVIFHLRRYTEHTLWRGFSGYERRLDIQCWDILPILKSRRKSWKAGLGFSDWTTSLCYRMLFIFRELELYSVEIWMNTAGIYCQS